MIYRQGGVLTFSEFKSSVSTVHEQVDNSFPFSHVTYVITEQQEEHTGYNHNDDSNDIHV